MIRTGEQYLESLRDGRRVLCGGEMIDDLTTHPKTRGYAQAVAEYYDMHHDPEHQDVMTFVDEDGERWAKHWFLPRTKEDLVARREYHDYIFRHWARGAMFTRPPASMLPVFYTLYQDPEPWETESRRARRASVRGQHPQRLGAPALERPVGVADVPRRPGRPLRPRLGGRDADAAHGRRRPTRASSCAAGRRSAPAWRSPTRSSWACSGSRAPWRSRSSSRSSRPTTRA